MKAASLPSRTTIALPTSNGVPALCTGGMGRLPKRMNTGCDMAADALIASAVSRLSAGTMIVQLWIARIAAMSWIEWCVEPRAP